METQKASYLIHITTSNHKVHHALMNDEFGRSPAFCGSERFGTNRNGSTISRPISCEKCRVLANCATCAQA